MVYYHHLTEKEIDITNCIKNHSGDETVAYKTVDGKPICLSLYYPPGYDTKEKYPVFVFVHGGGWAGRRIFSDQEHWAGDHLGFLARYYAGKGYVSVSIDYRLMQENGQKDGSGLMDLYEDCVDALVYLKEHESCYGLDFERSVLLGESAGGYLAAALITLPYLAHPMFQRAILVNPITDLLDSQWYQRVPKESDHPVLRGRSKVEIAHGLSPVYHISDGTPETLLLHGIRDSVVRPRHARSFYDEMCLHKREAQLHWISDTDHAFLLAEYQMEKGNSLSAAAMAIEIMDCWLWKNVK